MTTVSLFQFMPYGAPELQSVARQNMVRALLLSSVLCTMALASVGLVQMIPREGSGPPPIVISIDRILPPPSIDEYRSVPPVVPAAATRATAGIAVPVPDAQAAPEASIASQDQLRVENPGLGRGEVPIVIEQPAAPETLPAFRQYVYVDEMPAPVRTVEPVYSDIAREAGVTGRVVVYVLVGKDGRVRDARVDEKVNVPMLNDQALAAARQWVFKPALSNNVPVPVWVSVPFIFTLR